METNQKPWKTMKTPWKTMETNQKPTLDGGGGGQGRNKQKRHLGGVTTDLLDV